MESDKRYFIEGLFVIVLSVALAFFFAWLAHAGNKDDVTYRIHFAESVSGLELGDPVRFLGVEVGLVKSMAIKPDDPNRVEVDVQLRKDTPIKTDTTATLNFKGITGSFFIELSGGSAGAKTLVAATPQGQVPEIPAVRSTLETLMEQLPKVVSKFATIEDQVPKVVAKFSAIEDQTKKVVTNIGEVTNKVKENPSLLLRRPKPNDEGTKK
jgi:phospholipid/cholesterol/gamma-HCH transport system substrate-binding protein